MNAAGLPASRAHGTKHLKRQPCDDRCAGIRMSSEAGVRTAGSDMCLSDSGDILRPTDCVERGRLDEVEKSTDWDCWSDSDCAGYPRPARTAGRGPRLARPDTRYSLRLPHADGRAAPGSNLE